MFSPVASLGWVTHGAATEGVTPLFFSWKTWRPFFSRQFCGVIPGFFFSLLLKTWQPFFLIADRCHYHYCFHSGVTPSRLSPHTLFYLSDLVSPLFFVNLPTNFFLRVSPPWRVSPGAVRHPYSDATGFHCWYIRPTSRCVSLAIDSLTLNVCSVSVVTWSNFVSILAKSNNPRRTYTGWPKK